MLRDDGLDSWELVGKLLAESEPRHGVVVSAAPYKLYRILSAALTVLEASLVERGLLSQVQRGEQDAIRMKPENISCASCAVRIRRKRPLFDPRCDPSRPDARLRTSMARRRRCGSYLCEP